MSIALLMFAETLTCIHPSLAATKKALPKGEPARGRLSGQGCCPGKAYFNCHTDITIPYEELDEIAVIQKDGTKVPIIQKGRFVLPGTEELNVPLDEWK